MNATTARQAALQVLLQDVEPLIRQTEELAALLRAVQAQLHTDGDALRDLVRQCAGVLESSMEATRALVAAAERIDAASARLPGPSAAPRPDLGRGWLVGISLAGGLMSAALVTALLLLGLVPLRDEVQLGRAVQRAWPLLDTATRSKLQAAMDR